MSASKKLAANARKEANKTVYMARLVDNPTSPRKTRIMANVIRGKNVDYAMNVLKYSHRESAEKLLKLLKSAVANAENKDMDVDSLYVKECKVDQGPTLKRMRAASRGRGMRINKRTSNITVVLKERD